MDFLDFPRSDLKQHPISQWERGDHLPWYRRGRIPPPVLIAAAAAVVAFDLFLTKSRLIASETLKAAAWLSPWLLFQFGRRYAIATRMAELQKSGLIRDLYLTGIRPVETYAAFIYGNRYGLWDTLFLASLVAAAALLDRFLFYFSLAAVLLVLPAYAFANGRDKSDYRVYPPRDYWMLENVTPFKLLTKAMESEMWLFVFPVAVHYGGWINMLLYAAFLFVVVGARKRRRVMEMNETQFNNLLRRIIQEDEHVWPDKTKRREQAA